MVFGFATAVAQILVALTFIASGVGKLRTPGSVAQAVTALGLPARLGTGALGRAFPWLELLLGALLLVWWGPTAILPLGAALILAIGFTALVTRAVRGGTAASCNCFGGNTAVMSGYTVARNVGLTLLTVAAIIGRLLTLEHPVRLTPSFFVSLIVLAVAVAYVYALAASEYAGAAPARAAAPGTPSSPRPQMTTPTPAGDGSIQPLPEVEEEDYHRRPNPAVMLMSLTNPGEKVLTTQLIAEGPVLVLSVSATCGACTVVRNNEQQIIDKVPTLRTVYLFGSYTTELPELWEGTKLEAYYDPNDAFTGLVGMPMSPGMVLLGADGLLAAGPEYGFDAIMETVSEIAEVLAEVDAGQPADDRDSTDHQHDDRQPAPMGEVNK